MTGDDEETLFGRRSGKSPAAFRTISEVAADLELPTHVLRFWEGKFSGIKPLKRGGGRRYYRPEDVDLLRRIRRLLYEEGYTIKGAQRVLRDEPDDTAVAERPPPNEARPDEERRAERKPLAPERNDEDVDLRRHLGELIGELRDLRSLLDGREP